MKYDFLIAGFPKCGTTTCHNLLQQNPQIYLPECKETFYFSKPYLYKNKGGYLEENFYRNRHFGQKIGGVEPSFARYAKRVKPYLGIDTKVIFLVRNPIEYLLSYFRMCMSFGVWPWYEAYNAYGGLSGIIREYIKVEGGQFRLKRKNAAIADAIANGRYINYIQEYGKIIGIENLKIILFEDFIMDEKKTIDEICKVIGVRSCPIRMQVAQNKSQKIMPNSEIGRFLLEKREILHHNYIEKRKPINRMGMALCKLYYRWIPLFASKNMEDQIDESARNLLFGYYNGSVNELQKIINYDLAEKWKWNL